MGSGSGRRGRRSCCCACWSAVSLFARQMKASRVFSIVRVVCAISPECNRNLQCGQDCYWHCCCFYFCSSSFYFCFCMCCQPIPQTALPNWPLTDERAALTDWVPVLFQPLLLAGLAATSNALVNAAWPTVARLMSNSLCCCTGCAKWQINLSLLQQREQISIKVRAP